MNPMPWAFALAVAVVVAARPRRRTRDVTPAAPTDGGGVSTLRIRRTRTGPSARRTDDASEVAHWCESLSRAVRGGDTVLAALRSVEPPPRHATTAAALVREVERTGRIAAGGVDTSPHMALAVTVLAAVVEHGGPAAEPLDRAASVLRGRAAEHAERQVQSAQARLSAQVLSLLPGAMLALLVVTSASVRDVVVSPAGVALVGAGVCLDVAGWRWMRAIITRAAR